MNLARVLYFVWFNWFDSNNFLASANGISPGLKNLLSTAIGDESASKTTLITTSPSAAESAPTLTRLLDLPLTSPNGKLHAELAVAEETEVTTCNNTRTKAEEEVLFTKKEASDSTTLALEKIKEELLEGIPEALQKEGVAAATDSALPKVSGAASKISDEAPLTVEEVSAVIEELNESDEDRAGASEEAATEVTVEETVEMEEESCAAVKEDAVKEDTQAMNVAVESEIEVGPEESLEKSAEESVLEAEPATDVITTDVTTESSVVGEEEQVELNVKEEKMATEEDKVQVKEDKAASDVDTKSSKTDVESPKLSRRPLRTPRRKIVDTEKSVSLSEDTKSTPSKAAEVGGPTTRRSSGRSSLSKGAVEEAEASADTSPVSEMPELVEPSTINVVKRKVPPPPLPLPSLSPAPSSGIDSTPNSPTSSVSTVT